MTILVLTPKQSDKLMSMYFAADLVLKQLTNIKEDIEKALDLGEGVLIDTMDEMITLSNEILDVIVAAVGAFDITDDEDANEEEEEESDDESMGNVALIGEPPEWSEDEDAANLDKWNEEAKGWEAVDEEDEKWVVEDGW